MQGQCYESCLQRVLSALARRSDNHDTNRPSAIDARTTRHPGYRISTIKRKRIEEPFGWMKTVGGLRKLSLYGLVYLAGMAHAFDRRCTHDDGMAEQQFDLFAHRGGAIERGLSRSTHHALLATEIDDESLIAAIAESTLAEGCKLVVEAGRRRLAAAVPALAALCRSFTAFGTRRMIPSRLLRSRLLPSSVGVRQRMPCWR